MVVEKRRFALKVNMQRDREWCMKIFNKVLAEGVLTKGVQKWDVDEDGGKITVFGTVEPRDLIAAFNKEEKIVELLPEQSSNRTTEDPVFQGVHHLFILFLSILIAHHPFIAFLSILIALLTITVQGLQKFRKDDEGRGKGDNDSLSMSDADKNKISHSSHKHHFELQKNIEPFECSGCKRPGLGPRFKCHESCNYEALHKECMEYYWTTTTKTEKSFKGRTFKFFDQLPNKICDACRMDIHGFLFHSDAINGKSLDLHPCCSNLERNLCINDCDFELCDEVSSRSKCKWCNEKDLHGRKDVIPGWSYVSADKKYHFHVYCVSQMMQEAWKKGGVIHNIDSMALEKIDLQLSENPKKKKGKGGCKIVWTTTKIFLKTILAILLGDPTTIIASVVVELITSK